MYVYFPDLLINRTLNTDSLGVVTGVFERHLSVEGYLSRVSFSNTYGEQIRDWVFNVVYNYTSKGELFSILMTDTAFSGGDSVIRSQELRLLYQFDSNGNVIAQIEQGHLENTTTVIEYKIHQTDSRRNWLLRTEWRKGKLYSTDIRTISYY